MNFTADDPALQLAAFAREAAPAESAAAIFRLSLFDWAVLGRAAIAEPVAKRLRTVVEAQGGVGEASVIGGARLPARSAALVNGATTHALDFDDTHFAHIGHPSTVVIPVALALAEARGRSGAAFSDAALVGLEASVRIGLWLGRGHYQAGFHQTGTAGTFGAALAAARLLDLDAERTLWAIGHAASRAAGLKAQFGTMAKPMQAGQAAAAGVEAALLAEAGIDAAPAALAGPQGFGPTHHGAADATAFDDLGTRWLFEDVTHKLHACCHGTHAPIEAALTLAPDLDSARIGAVEVSVHPRWLTVCDIPAPATRLEAKFSLRLTTAMALQRRDMAGQEAFEPSVIADPALVALRDKVRVVADDALAETAALVRVDTPSGRAEASHDLLAPQSVEDKARGLRTKATALVGQGEADALWEICSADAPDPGTLGAALRAR